MLRKAKPWRLQLTCLASIIACLYLVIYFGTTNGQSSPNEREVRTEKSELDRSDVYALDFKFKDPRLIKAYSPATGTRIFLYLWYQVINRTNEPQYFTPRFELVTYDPPATQFDVILPMVQETIRKVEDPSNYQGVLNSVTINEKKIPVSKPAGEAFPRAVTGVAIWEWSGLDPKNHDPNGPDLSDTKQFTIYVQGLSNGSVTVDPPAAGQSSIVRNKQLKLNFKRRAERGSIDSRDIAFDAPAQWLYRAGEFKLIEAKK